MAFVSPLDMQEDLKDLVTPYALGNHMPMWCNSTRSSISP